MIPYLWNDCKAFCLERPRSTMLVLCSDRVEVAGLVTDLGKVGVDIRVITTARTERNELAAMVHMDKWRRCQ